MAAPRQKPPANARAYKLLLEVRTMNTKKTVKTPIGEVITATQAISDIYAVQDTDGLWVICKVCAGHMEVLPHVWNDKEIAERHAATLRAECCK
jgi:hypothetical protein